MYQGLPGVLKDEVIKTNMRHPSDATKSVIKSDAQVCLFFNSTSSYNLVVVPTCELLPQNFWRDLIQIDLVCRDMVPEQLHKSGCSF